MVSQLVVLAMTDVIVMLFISIDVVWQMLFAKDMMAKMPLWQML